MKPMLFAALIVSALTTGCVFMPMQPADADNGKAKADVRPEPVKADEITSENAWDKALQLHRELDYVEGKGETAK